MKGDILKMIINDISNLKIQKLTQEQYDTALKNNALDNESIYLTPIEIKDYAFKSDLETKADLIDGKVPLEQLPEGIGNTNSTISGAQIQSDWLQKDSNEKDYIKNKPFYDDSIVIEWNGPTNEFIDVTDELGVISYKVSNKTLTKQEIIGYEVIWELNNTIYSCIIDENNIVPVDDNFFVIFDRGSGLMGVCLKEGSPVFMGVTFENVTPGIWFNYSTDSMKVISLSKKDIKQIEEKYIPDIFIK
jgi:hypothetical protein